MTRKAAQDTSPNLVRDGKLEEIFDRAGRAKAHEEFAKAANADVGLQAHLEEIQRIDRTGEEESRQIVDALVGAASASSRQAAGPHAVEAADQTSYGQIPAMRKEAATTAPGKRAPAALEPDAPGKGTSPAPPIPVAPAARVEPATTAPRKRRPAPPNDADSTAVDLKPPRMPEVVDAKRQYFVRYAAYVAGALLLGLFLLRRGPRDEPPVQPSAQATAEATAAATATATVTAATGAPPGPTGSLTATLDETASASVEPESTGRPAAKTTSEPVRTAKASTTSTGDRIPTSSPAVTVTPSATPPKPSATQSPAPSATAPKWDPGVLPLKQ